MVMCRIEHSVASEKKEQALKKFHLVCHYATVERCGARAGSKHD